MIGRKNRILATMKNFVTILVLTLNLQFCLCDTSSNLTTVPPTISDLNIIKNVVSDYTESTTTTTMTPSSKSAGKQKPLYSTGNELWDNLIRDCLKKPTFSCIQKNVYTFLDSTLNQNDVNVTSRVQLTRNQLEYKISQTPKDEENEIYFEGRAAPIEEVSNALYDKGVKFMVTHNMDVQLPEIMFDGATFRISPRSIEGNGIIAKLEYIPKTTTEVEGRGYDDMSRLFKKKIKKFFKRKIVLAVLAIVLVIKIIKIKVFWLLPLLVGVGTAKKLVLKFLLFLFPALSSIFKLCGYYHANHHQTNFHHHKHNINHLHTVLYDGHDSHHGIEDHHHLKDLKDIFSKPPKGHASEYLHSAPVPPHLSFQPDEDWQFSGPGLGSEYISGIIDRKSHANFKPKLDDAKEIVQWGLKHPYHGVVPPSSHQNAISPTSHSLNVNPLIHKHRSNKKPVVQHKTYGVPNQSYGVPLSEYGAPQSDFAPPPIGVPNQSYGAPQSGYGVPQMAYGVPLTSYNSQQSTYGVPQQRISSAASQNHPQYVGAPDNQLIKAQRQEAMRIQKEQQLISKQQSILNQQPFVSDVEQPITPKLVDPFYSPILQKLDQVFLQLGYPDEPCRQRVVCNMYKAPAKYSPHSNYVSAELSRDSSELQRPVDSNTAVLRFYKYVQAARDGQDQEECANLYPCNLPTKK